MFDAIKINPTEIVTINTCWGFLLRPSLCKKLLSQQDILSPRKGFLVNYPRTCQMQKVGECWPLFLTFSLEASLAAHALSKLQEYVSGTKHVISVVTNSFIWI